MRILVICSLFPPDAKGGAELSAYDQCLWLRNKGYEVAVLTTAATPEQQVRGDIQDGIRMWKLCWPRPYPIHHHESASAWKKVQWHLQDHLDPRNVDLVKSVVDAFLPDIVHVHVLQGIGHNSLAVLNRAQLPVLYFLHDLGLACFRCSMYKNHQNCEGQCFTCRVSSFAKRMWIKDPSRYVMVSPSVDNWRALTSLVDLSRFHAEFLPNIDLDEPDIRSTEFSRKPLNLLFVGRLHPTKGIDFLLLTLEQINRRETVCNLTVVGGGPLEGGLLDRYARYPWVTFTGRIPPSSVNKHMSAADILCVPSLWRENHPGVVRQALRAGVPALVSNIGGAPEMIVDGNTGLVLPPGDELAWRNAIEKLAANPALVIELQRGALAAGRSYSADRLGGDLVRIVAAATSCRQTQEQTGPATESASST